MLNAECSRTDQIFDTQHSTFNIKHSRHSSMTTSLETKERLQPGAASSAMLWEYSPSPESTDHVKIESRYNLFIGGKFVEPHSKRWFETINPATEETLAEIGRAHV